jgi:large conductance mechanosensitive channel
MGLAYEDAKKQGAVLGYGKFITVAINFLIIAQQAGCAILHTTPPSTARSPMPRKPATVPIRDIRVGKRSRKDPRSALAADECYRPW